MAKKLKLQQDKITSRKELEIWDMGEPGEGVTDGKLDDSINFNKVGIKLSEGKLPTKPSWSKLPESMKNYYRKCYPKLTKQI